MKQSCYSQRWMEYALGDRLPTDLCTLETLKQRFINLKVTCEVSRRRRPNRCLFVPKHRGDAMTVSRDACFNWRVPLWPYPSLPHTRRWADGDTGAAVGNVRRFNCVPHTPGYGHESIRSIRNGNELPLPLILSHRAPGNIASTSSLG